MPLVENGTDGTYEYENGGASLETHTPICRIGPTPPIFDLFRPIYASSCYLRDRTLIISSCPSLRCPRGFPHCSGAAGWLEGGRCWRERDRRWLAGDRLVADSCSPVDDMWSQAGD